jgi:hypothetical protein
MYIYEAAASAIAICSGAATLVFAAKAKGSPRERFYTSCAASFLAISLISLFLGAQHIFTPYRRVPREARTVVYSAPFIYAEEEVSAP